MSEWPEDAQKGDLLTLPTLADTSPARPESAKTASSPKDAPWPKQGRSGAVTSQGVAGMIPTARNIPPVHPSADFSPTQPPAAWQPFTRDALYPERGPSNSLYLPLGEWPRLPSTTRIERAPFYRARSASKEGTWPLLPHPSEVARARGSFQLPRPFSASCSACAHVSRSR